MNPSFDNGIQVSWDATSLELFQTCARKYYYRMILSVAPKNLSVHLLFGGLYASALEHYHLARAGNMSHETALRLVVREALVNSWSHEIAEDGQRVAGTGQPVPFDSAAKTRSTLIRSIIWYLEQLEEESANSLVQTYVLASGKPAVELSFGLEMSDDIMWHGHLDRVVHYGDGLYWVDNKTSGSPLTPYFFRGFETSNQFMGYTWAGRTVLRSPIRGGLIEAAYITAGFTQFERQPIVFSADRISEWFENTIHTIKSAQAATALRKFPMNLTACGNYGGCPYRSLCVVSPRIREHVLQSDFKAVAPWSPATPR